MAVEGELPISVMALCFGFLRGEVSRDGWAKLGPVVFAVTEEDRERGRRTHRHTDTHQVLLDQIVLNPLDGQLIGRRGRKRGMEREQDFLVNETCNAVKCQAE